MSFRPPFLGLRLKLDPAGPDPIYRQISLQIKDYLRKKALPRGTPLPTIGAITEMGNVSLNTAQRALTLLTQEGVCVRRPKKGTFVSEGFAGAAAVKKIAGIYHMYGQRSLEIDSVAQAVYAGIAEASGRLGLDSLFLSHSIEESLRFYSGEKNIRFQGLLLLHPEGFHMAKAWAVKFPRLRFVCLNYFFRDFEDSPPNLFGIFNDDYAGTYQMTCRLAKKGHRRIAFFSLDIENENYHLRQDGYRDALVHSGLSYDPRGIFSIPAVSGMGRVELPFLGEALAKKLRASDFQATAVMCANDFLASGCLRVTVGEMEVAGYDYVFPYLSESGNFSTVSIPFREMGEMGLEVMAYPERSYPKIIRIVPQILPPPKSVQGVSRAAF